MITCGDANMAASYQSDGHEDDEQRQMMEDQHPLLHQEGLHGVQRVTPGVTFDLLDMIVAQVHGDDVSSHVGSSEQHEPVRQPVTAKTTWFLIYREKEKCSPTLRTLV